MKMESLGLTRLSFASSQNEVQYLFGNMFDSGAWKQLGRQNFNLTFSDACYSADALYAESAESIRNDLLDPDAVMMIWDDLHNDMEHAYRGICIDLCARRSSHNSFWFTASLKDWLSDNWEDYPIDFFISQRK